MQTKQRTKLSISSSTYDILFLISHIANARTIQFHLNTIDMRTTYQEYTKTCFNITQSLRT